MTTTEAAAALGVTPRRVRALIASGALTAVKQGRDYHITAGALEAVRERNPGRPKHDALGTDTGGDAE